MHSKPETKLGNFYVDIEVDIGLHHLPTGQQGHSIALQGQQGAALSKSANSELTQHSKTGKGVYLLQNLVQLRNFQFFFISA